MSKQACGYIGAVFIADCNAQDAKSLLYLQANIVYSNLHFGQSLNKNFLVILNFCVDKRPNT